MCCNNWTKYSRDFLFVHCLLALLLHHAGVSGQVTEKTRRNAILKEIHGSVREILNKIDGLDVQRVRNLESSIALTNTKLDRLTASVELSKVGSGALSDGLARLEERMKNVESLLLAKVIGGLGNKIGSMEKAMLQWEEVTKDKLSRLMNVITPIYEFIKDLKQTFGEMSKTQTVDLSMGDLLTKIKEQISIVSVEMRTQTESVGSKVLGIRTQLDQLTTQLIELKDDLPKDPLKPNRFGVGVPHFQVPPAKCSPVNVSQIQQAIKESNQNLGTKLESALKAIESKMGYNICENQIGSGKHHPVSRPAVEESRGFKPVGPQAKSYTKTIQPIVGSAMPAAASGCTRQSSALNSESCSQLRTEGQATCDGVYIIMVAHRAVRVYCDMSDGFGGWTVIMRRGNFSNRRTPFDQNWQSFKNGFGDKEDEFWLGNELVHQMTHARPNELQVDLEAFDGDSIALKYEFLKIGSEYEGYKLNLGRPKTSNSNPDTRVANLFLQHNGSTFTTFDRNVNGNSHENCAAKMGGGWWFSQMTCSDVFLTGPLFGPNERPQFWEGIQWPSWKKNMPLKAVQMKIRSLT